MPLTTKRALAASFKKLLSKRRLDKITVREITDDCGVNRQTFYYHFHDIYDLMDWCFQDTADAITQSGRDYGDWSSGVDMLMRYLRAEQDLLRNAYHSASHELVVNHIKKILRPYIQQMVRSHAGELSQPPAEENVDFVADVFTIAAVGLLTEYIDSRLGEETEERFRKFGAAVDGSVLFMLRNLGET